MKKRNNIMTIFRKECARFFRDKQLFFTSVIMPGLLLYLVYTFMGQGISKSVEEEIGKTSQPVAVLVQNMPQEMMVAFDSLDVQTGRFDTASVMAQIRNKDNNVVYVEYPATVTSEIPNIRIYYNSANLASQATYQNICERLNSWESSQIPNLFDINMEEQNFDLASADDIDSSLSDIFSRLIPMLILMMLFSACMAIAPSAIAGEKERGTIATLLVTPMKRSELAWGKILSLSLFALLSGCSSFIGIMLSLPKMSPTSDVSIDMSRYVFSDYVALLCIILSAVLVMTSCISILSAIAKDVKSAGTLVVPFMLAVMGIGISPMLTSGAVEGLGYYFIPFFNSVHSMSAVFSHQASMMPIIITFACNISYTMVSVWVLSRMFNSEKIMFSR